jgi:hypothetical protein
MKNVIRFRATASLCRQLAAYNCLQREAEYWQHERHTDEVAIAPYQTTIAASAKFIEEQFKIQRYGGKSCARTPAPAFCNIRDGARRTPVCAPNNRNASLSIFILPIDRRSSIIRVLNDPLVDPVSPVVPSPDAIDHKPAGKRSSRNDDGPEVPNLCPGGLGNSVQNRKIVVALRGHLRRTPSVRAHGASSRAVAPSHAILWTCLRSRCHSRNRLARSPGEADAFGVLGFDVRLELEEIIC